MDDDEIAVEVPNTMELQRLTVEARKRISDLPVPVGKMNVISLILVYSMFGVRDSEIALALGLTEANVVSVRESPFYDQVQKEIKENILASDAEAVRSMFVQSSIRAVRKIDKLIDSKDSNVALSASKDVLDRAGHRPVDVHEHRVSVEGGLKIEYVDRKAEQLPLIDVTVDQEF